MHVTPTSPRLTFRPCDHADVERLHRHWNDPAVRLHLWDDRPVALDTVREVVAASGTSFVEHAYGIWLLADERGFAGMCGLRATGAGEVEVLYSIEPDRWGRGLATEAARAVVHHALTTLDLPRVLGGVDAVNHASRRVLEKLGMTPFPTPAGTPPGVAWLQIARERWRATSA